MSFAEKLQKCPLIAILRGITPAEIDAVCEVLYESGFRMLEIPLNSPDALESIRRAAERWHVGEKMLVGAGTVLSAADVERVAAAGGKFIISPDTNPEVIRATKRAGLVSMPGFFTASEGFAALRAGAQPFRAPRKRRGRPSCFRRRSCACCATRRNRAPRQARAILATSI